MSSKFDPRACRVLINLALSRIKLHKNKKTEFGQILRREVLGLLKQNKEEQARIRTVNIIHNDYYVEVLNVLESFLNALSISIDVIAAQLSCPLDMKEAVASIIYAAPFLENSSELVKLRSIFVQKFENENLKSFIHPKVISGLSHDMPDDALINYYISIIVGEHQTNDKVPENEQLKPTVSSQPTHSTISTNIQTPPKTNTQSSMISNLEQGVFTIDQNGNSWVLRQNPNLPPIYIPHQHTNNSKEGQVVHVQLDQRADNKCSGKVVDGQMINFPDQTNISSSSHHTSSFNSNQTINQQNINNMSSNNANSTNFTSSKIQKATLFKENVSGVFKTDLKGHSWLIDNNDHTPYFLPAIYRKGLIEGAQVDQAQIFKTENAKYFAKVSNSAQSNASQLAQNKHEQYSRDKQSLLDPFEMNGIFYSQNNSETFCGIVFDENEPSNLPVLIEWSNNDPKASHGDRVTIKVFGKDLKSGNFVGKILKITSTISNNKSDNDATSSDNYHSGTISAINATSDGQITTSLNTSSHHPQTPLQVSGDVENSQSNGIKRRDLFSSMVEEGQGDFDGILEIDESTGDGFVLHPTLPWTTVIIPSSQLGKSIRGDEVSIVLEAGAKPKNGKMLGKLLGITKPNLESYQISSTINFNTDEDHLRTSRESQVENQQQSIDELESALKDLQSFDDQRHYDYSNEEQIIEVEGFTNPETQSKVEAEQKHIFNPSETIVIDIGSGYIKAGYSNQPVPIIKIPTLLGVVQNNLQNQNQVFGASKPNLSSFSVHSISSSSSNDIESRQPYNMLFGQEAFDKRSILDLSRPYWRGHVSDWPGIRSLLDYVLCNRLNKLDLSICSVVVICDDFENLLPMHSEAPNASEYVSNMSRILYDDLQVSHVAFLRKSLSVLCSERKLTGIVVDIGHTTTSIVAIHEGRILDYASSYLDLGGSDITDRMVQLLVQDGNRFFNTVSQREAAYLIKEEHCFVESFESKNKVSMSSRANRTATKPFILADGTQIDVSHYHATQCTEILFDPKLVGKDYHGLHEQIVQQVLLKCEAEIRSELAANILLVGGSASIQGLRQRLTAEIDKLIDSISIHLTDSQISQAFKQNLNQIKNALFVFQPSKSQFSAWIGGSMVARSSDFEDIAIPNKIYQKTKREL